MGALVGQWEYCTTRCKECPHCEFCGGSATRGGPYGCTCDEEDPHHEEDL